MSEPHRPLNQAISFFDFFVGTRRLVLLQATIYIGRRVALWVRHTSVETFLKRPVETIQLNVTPYPLAIALAI